MNKKYLILMFGVFLLGMVSLVSAEVNCPNTYKELIYNEGDIPPADIVVTNGNCWNDGNNSNIILEGDGVPGYIKKGSDMEMFAGDRTLRLDIEEDIPQGVYIVTYSFEAENSDAVVVRVEIKGPEEEQNPGDISFPTTKRITVKKGEIKNTKVTLILPSNYPNSITIVAIEFSEESGIVSFGDVETGIVNPGTSKDIPLVVDATDAGLGQYPTIKVLVRYDEGGIYELSSKLEIEVTSNINPITGDTFSTKPSCALSSSDMSLNSTYVLTCSGVVNNLEVNPQYNEHFEGLSVDTTSSIFTYTFKPVKYGNTDFLVLFSYGGSPIFSPFTSDVRIRSTSGVSQGTNLKFLFTPSLDIAQNGGVVVVQLIDNKTNSLVENPHIEVNAIPITNRSGNTFFHAFEVGKSYTLRGSTEGYSDLVETVNLTSKPITILINPSTGNTNTDFNITTNENATIFVDGTNRGTQFLGRLSGGNHIIEAFKDGFFDKKINLTVENSVTFGTSGEFKKGVLQTITLSKNVTWEVLYQKDPDTSPEIYNGLTGFGNSIEFTPKKTGTYIVKSDDGSQRTFVIDGWDWNKKWWFMAWYWWVVGLTVIIIVVKKYKGKGSSSSIGELPGFKADIQH